MTCKNVISFRSLSIWLPILLQFLAISSWAGGGNRYRPYSGVDYIEAARRCAAIMRFDRSTSVGISYAQRFPIKPYSLTAFIETQSSNPFGPISALTQIFQSDYSPMNDSGLRIEPHFKVPEQDGNTTWFAISAKSSDTGQDISFSFPRQLLSNVDAIANLFEVDVNLRNPEVRIMMDTTKLQNLTGRKHSKKYVQIILKFVPARTPDDPTNRDPINQDLSNLGFTYSQSQLIELGLLEYSIYRSDFKLGYRSNLVGNLLLSEITIRQGDNILFQPFWQSTRAIPVETLEEILWKHLNIESAK